MYDFNHKEKTDKYGKSQPQQYLQKFVMISSIIRNHIKEGGGIISQKLTNDDMLTQGRGKGNMTRYHLLLNFEANTWFSIDFKGEIEL